LKSEDFKRGKFEKPSVTFKFV